MLQAVGLSTHIANNNIKSFLLLLGYPVLLLLMLWSFGFLLHVDRFGVEGSVRFGNQFLLDYGHWAIGAALLWFLVAWFFHGAMINRASGARPVSRQQAPEIYNMLENLCISRGLSMPRLQIIETQALNAFASGINEKTYAITLTSGLIEKLKPDELEAVLGHELTHIINRDVRLLIIGVIFAGMISFFAEMVFRSLLHGRRGYYYRRRRDNDSRGAIYFLLIATIILMIGKLFSAVIRLAISRKREFLADAGSVELTKNPDAMMRALLRISGHEKVEGMSKDIMQMCIENNSGFLSIFATHPPIKERIEVISKMTNTPVPAIVGPWGERA